MRAQLAHCHVGLSKLHRRCGDCDPARQYLAKAAAMYSEMRMTY